LQVGADGLPQRGCPVGHRVRYLPHQYLPRHSRPGDRRRLAMYTTVITPTSLTGYYNGSRIGAVDLDRAVSDFGTDLVGYIGRSTYADEFYQGAVDEVIVSTAAYDPADVSELYYGSDRVSTQQRREDRKSVV